MEDETTGAVQLYLNGPCSEDIVNFLIKRLYIRRV
jgi:hypothetical protein